MSTILKTLYEWRINFCILLVAALLEIYQRGLKDHKIRVSQQLQFNIFYFLAGLYLTPILNNWVIRRIAPIQNHLLQITQELRNKLTIDFQTITIISPKLTYILAGLTFLLIWDFFQYWVHRLLHFGFVYSIFHSFHHNVHMSVLNSFRHHPLETIFLNFALNIPVALFVSVVYPDFQFQIFWVVMTVFALFLHADIEIPPLPLIQNIMMLPNHHRIHHSYSPRHFNKNFGQYFTIWDRLFGTYSRPIYREELYTGKKMTWIENTKSMFWMN
jgi:sterol desaturase/sphingolipid hydroxylase (fatty acid hydroxylase superfamily)